MPNFGLIDLGSNTIRLCIYQVDDPNKQRLKKKEDFRSLINHKNMTGLASYVREGFMTEEGIATALDVLKGHLRRAAYFKCEELHIFATACLRNCVNSQAACEEIARALQVPVELLSDQDEAHLGVVGVQSTTQLKSGIVFDLGGGSCEFSCLKEGLDSLNTSIDQGSLSSYTQHVEAILPHESELCAIAESFRGKLNQKLPKKFPRTGELYGLGGSMRAVAKLHAAATGRPLRPNKLSLQEIDHVLKVSLRNPNTFAHLALRAAPDRIHTVIPGCIMAREIMEHFHAPEINLVKGGVREGYLIERLLKK